MPSVSFTYKQNADAVYQFVTNPDEVKTRCQSFGETNIEIDVSEDGGTKTLATTREVETDLPKFAKKFFKARNKVLDRKEWRDTGDKKTAKLHVDTIGTPAKMNGDITISPEGQGCRYTIDFTTSVKIPLVGKKLETFIAGLMERELKKEFEYNQAKLDAG